MSQSGDSSGERASFFRQAADCFTRVECSRADCPRPKRLSDARRRDEEFGSGSGARRRHVHGWRRCSPRSKSDSDVLREVRDAPVSRWTGAERRHARGLNRGDAKVYAALEHRRWAVRFGRERDQGTRSAEADDRAYTPASGGRTAGRPAAADVSHHGEPPDRVHRQGSRPHLRVPHHGGCGSRTRRRRRASPASAAASTSSCASTASG